MPLIDLVIPIDEDLKNQAEELFNSLGFTLEEAILLFIKKVIAEQGIPFEITLKTKSTYDERKRNTL